MFRKTWIDKMSRIPQVECIESRSGLREKRRREERKKKKKAGEKSSTAIIGPIDAHVT